MSKVIEELKKQIILVAENAYRRGYQHGNLYSGHGVTQQHCIEYRFEKPLGEAWCCPEKYHDGVIRMRQMLGVDLEVIHLGGGLGDILNYELKVIDDAE
jgi:hypothetical protein